ncbi:hypothetical protein, partial [Thorsellia kenyensis]
MTITEISDDSGALGDWITNDPTLIIKGALANGLAMGERVEINIDGQGWVQVTVTDRTWFYDNTSKALSNGTHKIDVRIINNVNDEGPKSSQEIIVDNKAPDITNKVYLDRISEDRGIADNDFKTNDKTLEFFGHLDRALDADEYVEISFDNGTTWTRTIVTGTEWYYDRTSTPF